MYLCSGLLVIEVSKGIDDYFLNQISLIYAMNY
jgi:hypothetical protein